jgi:hypothetical protein
MATRRVVVHEKTDVNLIQIENLGDDPIYVQAGEIVKGGLQDRAMGTDLVVTRSARSTPMDSFCVDLGRWEARGVESSSTFEESSDVVAGKFMKFGSNINSGVATQKAVWASISTLQTSLAQSIGENVQAAAWPNSYLLTMESAAIKKAISRFGDSLQGQVDKEQNVIGWIYAINGTIAGGDLYASPAMFRSLWPKLLKSGIVEAIGASHAQAAAQPAPTFAQVEAFLNDAVRAGPTLKAVYGRTRVSSYDSPECLCIRSDDIEGGTWIHRAYLVKDQSPLPTPRPAPSPPEMAPEAPEVPLQFRELR